MEVFEEISMYIKQITTQYGIIEEETESSSSLLIAAPGRTS